VYWVLLSGLREMDKSQSRTAYAEQKYLEQVKQYRRRFYSMVDNTYGLERPARRFLHHNGYTHLFTSTRHGAERAETMKPNIKKFGSSKRTFHPRTLVVTINGFNKGCCKILLRGSQGHRRRCWCSAFSIQDIDLVA
jgi:hypothetical protein